MNIPNINFTPIANDYTTVSVNGVNLIMKEGYVFYRASDYEDWTDEEGKPCEPSPEDISYLRAWYNISPTYDFSNIIIVPEREVPTNQII